MRRSYIQHEVADYLDFTVPKRYSKLQLIGNGAQGNVCSAFDSKSQEMVAIKKLKYPFSSAAQAQRMFREIALMRVCKHKNVIKILEILTPERNVREFKDVYIVMEFVEMSLDQAIKDVSKKINFDEISYITYQLSCGIKFMQTLGILHRDLKPANIGLTRNLEVRILDFGLARISSDDQDNHKNTPCVVTRAYRAPEVILSWRGYNKALDVWSLGCVMGEMLLHGPMFGGGVYSDEIELYLDIVTKIGPPKEEWFNGLEPSVKRSLQQRTSQVDDRTGEFLARLSQQAEGLADTSSEQVEGFMDLLMRMLTLDPEQRVTVDQILEHSFLNFNKSEEAEASPRPEEVRRVLSIESISNDKTLSINEWKNMIYDLITQKQGRTEQSLPWLILPVGVTVGYLVQNSSNQKRMSYTAVLCGCVSAVVYYMSYKIALQM